MGSDPNAIPFHPNTDDFNGFCDTATANGRKTDRNGVRPQREHWPTAEGMDRNGVRPQREHWPTAENRGALATDFDRGDGVMTSRPVVFAELFELGDFGLADVGGLTAAGVKAAASRWVEWGR